jgi:transposase
VFCGIDWSEKHHDVAVIDDAGQLLAKARISDDAAGYRKLLDLLAEHGDTEAEPIPVAIETSRGLLVAALRTGKRQVYAINPLAASRYRDRHSVSRKKSDPGDALVLANILRTDLPMHRPLPADSELAQAIAVLARAQQDAVWNRQQIGNQLRSLLREYYPAALDAFLTGRKGGPGPPRGPRRPGHRPHAGEGGPAVQDPDPRGPQAGRPPARGRGGGRPPAKGLPRRVRPPAGTGGGGHGQTDARPVAPTRRRRSECR